MKRNKISVVITTCKRPVNVLKRSIDSVLAQTYDNFNLIIVDDSPTEYKGRGEIAEFMDSLKDKRVLYLQNEYNMGACASRNKGAGAKECDFLAFLDDDDEWLPDKLQKQLEAFDDESIALVYCNTYIVNQTKNKVTVNYKNKAPLSGMVFEELFHNNFVGSASLPMIRKRSFDRVGGFDINMPALQDWDMWLRIAEKEKVKYISDILCKYYIYKGERITLHPEKRLAGYERILQKYRQYLAEHIYAQANFDLAGAYFYSRGGDLKKAVALWKSAVKNKPDNWKENLIVGSKMFLYVLLKRP